MAVEHTEADLSRHIVTDRLLPAAATRRDFQRFIAKRIPPFIAPQEVSRWPEEAERLRRRVLAEVMLRGVPEEAAAAAPQIEWGEEIRPGRGYTIRKLRYEGYPGMWVPALLYVPEHIEGTAPVVLNVNGHVGPLGKAYPEEQVRCINLAKRGLIAMHPEWLVFGELGSPGNQHDKLAYLDLCGRAGVSVFYLHLKRALDVLLGLPEADPERVAVTGLSGGGWQTITIAALDTRVSAAIPNAGYIGTLWRLFAPDDAGDVEQQPSDLIPIADYPHLTALLAPRPALLIYNAYDDCCFLAHRAYHSLFVPVKPLYDRLGAGERLAFHENHDPGTHNYAADNRKALYRFLNQQLLGGAMDCEDLPCDGEVLSSEDLSVGIPEDNATLTSLARDLSRDLPADRAPVEEPARLASWQEQARPVLRGLLRARPLAPVSAELSGEEVTDAGRVRQWAVQAGPEWTLPVVEYAPRREEGAPVAIVVADGGKASAGPRILDLWRAGHRVLAADVFYIGELALQERYACYLAQMVASVGERPLGLQVAHLEALVQWAAAQYGPCTFFASGRMTSVAAAAAAALDSENRVTRLVTEHLPATLKLLIEEDAGFGEQPTLFCFGLLARFDIRELLALCAGREVECRAVWGDPTRVEAELGPLGSLFAAGGGRFWAGAEPGSSEGRLFHLI
jgi:dienelactone hydrolase